MDRTLYLCHRCAAALSSIETLAVVDGCVDHVVFDQDRFLMQLYGGVFAQARANRDPNWQGNRICVWQDNRPKCVFYDDRGLNEIGLVGKPALGALLRVAEGGRVLVISVDAAPGIVRWPLQQSVHEWINCCEIVIGNAAATRIVVNTLAEQLRFAGEYQIERFYVEYHLEAGGQFTREVFRVAEVELPARYSG